MVSLSVSAERVEALRQGISPGRINPVTERRREWDTKADCM